MDDKYLKLFINIAHATMVIAQQVINLNHEQNDEQGEKTAQIMHDDFEKLYNKLSADNFNAETITKNEYAKLLVGTLIIINNLKEKINNEQKAIQGYEKELYPKLQKIIDAPEDEDITTLAAELFKIEKN